MEIVVCSAEGAVSVLLDHTQFSSMEDAKDESANYSLFRCNQKRSTVLCQMKT